MSDYSLPKFGTPDQSPFDFLNRPRAVIAPEPKMQGKSIKLALHTAVERRGYFNVAIASQASSDRTNSIAARLV